MAKYRWKTRPYVHQAQAVKKLLSTGFGGALLMAPRTGKTKTLIDYASCLHAMGKASRVLIFCPLSVIGVWEQEIAAHCPFPTRVVVWDKESRKKGMPLPGFDGKDVLNFVIINYDALSTPGAVIEKDEWGNVRRSKSRGGRFTVFKALYRWQPDLIALDESHRIKSPSAVKSRMLHKLGKVAPYRVIMTGTVVTKKKRVFDIWSQWKFLYPDRFPMPSATSRIRMGCGGRWRGVGRSGCEIRTRPLCTTRSMVTGSPSAERSASIYPLGEPRSSLSSWLSRPGRMTRWPRKWSPRSTLER